MDKVEWQGTCGPDAENPVQRTIIRTESWRERIIAEEGRKKSKYIDVNMCKTTEQEIVCG